jgi:hypothetical protein
MSDEIGNPAGKHHARPTTRAKLSNPDGNGR